MTTITETLQTPATAAAIRTALTTPDGLRAWWSRDCDIGSGEGATHELRFDKDGNTVVMRFRVEVDAADRVRWTCTDNGNPIWPGTTLEWRFADGRVDFEHAGFAAGVEGTMPYQMTVGGWQHFLGSLGRHLAGDGGAPW